MIGSALEAIGLRGKPCRHDEFRDRGYESAWGIHSYWPGTKEELHRWAKREVRTDFQFAMRSAAKFRETVHAHRIWDLNHPLPEDYRWGAANETTEHPLGWPDPWLNGSASGFEDTVIRDARREAGRFAREAHQVARLYRESTENWKAWNQRHLIPYMVGGPVSWACEMDGMPILYGSWHW